MKASNLLLITLFAIGCNHTEQPIDKKIDFDFYQPPPPPPSIPMPTSAPNFIPKPIDFAEIQINEIPHPFNLNGHIPCQVWVNGERLNISPAEAQKLAKAVKLDKRSKIELSKLHSGDGWLAPLKVK